MYRTGTATLPLHGGKAPSCLAGRMCGLAHQITDIIVDEYGQDEFIRRLSGPYGF